MVRQLKPVSPFCRSNYLFRFYIVLYKISSPGSSFESSENIESESVVIKLEGEFYKTCLISPNYFFLKASITITAIKKVNIPVPR